MLACFSRFGFTSETGGVGTVLSLSALDRTSALPALSSSSCDRDTEEWMELDVFLSVGELNIS